MKKTRKQMVSIAMVLAMMTGTLAGCGSTAESPAAGSAPVESAETSAAGTAAAAGDLSVESLGIEFLVPDGDMIPDIPADYDGRPSTSVPDFAETLTPEDLEKVVNGSYTAVFCTFDGESAWGRSMSAAVKSTLEKLNIELLASTDSSHDVQSCVENFESAMQLKPDVAIIVSMDPGAEKQGWDEAIANGTKLVFVQNVPDDYVCNEDYYGMVVPDNYTQNYVGSRQMLEAVQEGEVVYINITYDNYENRIRQVAFADACKEFPNITQLDTATVMSIEEAAAFAESMAQTHPELKGVSGLYDELVMAAVNSMNGLGMDVKGGTNGISELSALSMIQGTGYIGSGTEAAYDMGCAAALLAAASLAEVECPEVLVTPTVVINKDNIEEAWYKTYHEELPDNLKTALEASK